MTEKALKITDIKNSIPLVIAILTLAGAFYAQSAKLDVTNERLKNLIDQMNRNEVLYNDHETRLRVVEADSSVNKKDIESNHEDIQEIRERLRLQ